MGFRHAIFGASQAIGKSRETVVSHRLSHGSAVEHSPEKAVPTFLFDALRGVDDSLFS
jgi:hypothetical protein